MLAGFKGEHPPGFNNDRFAGPRIPGIPGFFVPQIETGKSDDTDILPFTQNVFDFLQHHIHRRGSFLPGKTDPFITRSTISDFTMVPTSDPFVISTSMGKVNLPVFSPLVSPVL